MGGRKYSTGKILIKGVKQKIGTSLKAKLKAAYCNVMQNNNQLRIVKLLHLLYYVCYVYYT